MNASSLFARKKIGIRLGFTQKVRITCMNASSLFARKNIGIRLGFTQRDASSLFHREEHHEGG